MDFVLFRNIFGRRLRSDCPTHTSLCSSASHTCSLHGKSPKNFGQLCPISKKSGGRRPISQKRGKYPKNLSTTAIQSENPQTKTCRGSGPNPMAHGGCRVKAPPLATRPKRGLQLPWDLLQNSPLCVASSPVPHPPHFLDGHTDSVRCKAIPASSCPGPALGQS